MNHHIGIDPGTTSGYAVVDDLEKILVCGWCEGRNPAEVARVAELMPHLSTVTIETWPAGALKSANALVGLVESAGIWMGALISAQRPRSDFNPDHQPPIVRVQAPVWRRALGIQRGSGKAGVLSWLRLTMESCDAWNRTRWTRDNNAADAACLAIYGARQARLAAAALANRPATVGGFTAAVRAAKGTAKP